MTAHADAVAERLGHPRRSLRAARPCKRSCSKSPLPSDRAPYLHERMFPGSESRSARRSTSIVEFSTLGEYRLGADAAPPAPRAPPPTLLRHRSWEAPATIAARAAVRRIVAGGAAGAVPAATPAARRRARRAAPAGGALLCERRRAVPGPTRAGAIRSGRAWPSSPPGARAAASSAFSQPIGSGFLPSVEPSSSTKRRNRSRSGTGEHLA